MCKLQFFYIVLAFLLFGSDIYATNYFIATNGNDSNSGTIEAPFASLKKAQSLVVAGDTVFIRGGRYVIPQDDIMTYSSIWGYVFDLQKSGTAAKSICYFGYRNERPVFDLSNVKPAEKRVIVFYIKGSYLHLKNFDIVGTQVTIVGHTQSECIRLDGGNHTIIENITMRDGKAIGFYLVRGMNNLVLNCDAYNNYDDVSDGGKGGNVDGFGGHPNATATGNVFRGCRAWYNSDDGFDLINAHSAYTIENCWSFYNGYRPGTFTAAGDGSGFKSGGYGMSATPSVPAVIPRHIVRFCLAYYNRAQGFYANHHLGGINWHNNTGYQNPSNFNMLNRKSAAEVVDVPGYGHQLYNNLSFSPRSTNNHIINVNTAECILKTNSFLPSAITVNASDFESINPSELMLPRKPDGSLPDISFLKPKKGSQLINMGTPIGYSYSGPAPDLGCFEYQEPPTALEDTKDSGLTVNIRYNSIVVKADVPGDLHIFSINGSFAAVRLNSSEQVIPLHSGVYILKMNGFSKKIMIFGQA